MAVNLHKNNIEPHENFTGAYEKNIDVLDELQDTISKDREVDKLCQKLFDQR